jgi:hypothetical protein
MSDIIDNLSFVPGLNLNDLRFTDAHILAAETLIAQSIADRQPSLDMSPASSLYDIHVRPAAIDYLNMRAMNLAIQATRSLQGVKENPALASDAVVDAILSDYGIIRRSGTTAQGTVRVNVSRDVIYSIGATQAFATTTGAAFVSTGTFLALSDPTDPSHLRLYPADGLHDQFFFLIPVSATAPGLASQIASDVDLTPAPPIPNFVSASSFGAFTGAANQETNAQLSARIPAAISAKNRVSPVAITSEMKDNFPAVLDVSVRGFGDADMIRGVGGVLPVKGGGFADIWVRTSLSVESSTVPLTAVVGSIDSQGRAVCSCTIPASAQPGFYMVGSVLPGESTGLIGSYTILSQARTKVVSGHKLASVLEAAYSPFQSMNLVFAIDAIAGQPFPGVNDDVPVQVVLAGLPLIEELQTFIDDPLQRASGTDYLVRAAVPCFVWCDPITVHITADASGDAVQQAVFAYINQLKMGTPLFTDSILLAIRNVAGVNRVDLPIRLYGRIFCPDGSVLDISGVNALTIPSQPAIQVTPQTTAFFASIDDIALNFVVSP